MQPHTNKASHGCSTCSLDVPQKDLARFRRKVAFWIIALSTMVLATSPRRAPVGGDLGFGVSQQRSQLQKLKLHGEYQQLATFIFGKDAAQHPDSHEHQTAPKRGSTSRGPTTVRSNHPKVAPCPKREKQSTQNVVYVGWEGGKESVNTRLHKIQRSTRTQ